MEKLLDAKDTSGRLLQHSAMLTGLILLVLAVVVFVTSPEMKIPAAVAGVLGLIAFVCGLRVKMCWEVSYKGHAIRFENDPLRGEALYIDGELVARGGLGIWMVLQGSVRSGAGIGDQIIAESVAGLLSFRCKISAKPSSGS